MALNCLIYASLFQSTPSAWRVTGKFTPGVASLTGFQSTPSAWRVTLVALVTRRSTQISIHTLRMEGDQAMRFHSPEQVPFQSTPSAWRVTPPFFHGRPRYCYFNPHPPHGG